MSDEDRAIRGRRRLRWFALHLALFAVIMLMVLVINVLFSPGDFWGIMVIVGWGGILAVHAAYVMGLFDVFGRSAPRQSQDEP